METTFYNVTITIKAENPKEAYTKLCNAMATLDPDAVLHTDTYTTDQDDDPDNPENDRDTSELWPDNPKPIEEEKGV